MAHPPCIIYPVACHGVSPGRPPLPVGSAALDGRPHHKTAVITFPLPAITFPLSGWNTVARLERGTSILPREPPCRHRWPISNLRGRVGTFEVVHRVHRRHGLLASALSGKATWPGFPAIVSSAPSFPLQSAVVAAASSCNWASAGIEIGKRFAGWVEALRR